MRTRRSLIRTGVLLALALVGCGGAAGTAKTASAPEAPAPKPKPRNADAIARSIVGGEVDLLVFADRVRGHPVAPKIAALDVWGTILEGTGIDPEKDLERAYVTSKT